MINNANNRMRPNQAYANRKFNSQVNKVKRVNTTFNKRGGIKL